MSQIIQLEQPVSAPLSKDQKTFNRLKNKIQKLQQQLKSTQNQLDECLRFYYDRIESDQVILVDLLKNIVKILYKHYTGSNFSKKNRRILKEVILNKMDTIFEFVSLSHQDPDIIAIFEDLEGVNYNEVVSNEIQSLKNEMKETFGEMGMDINLSKIDQSDDESEVLRKLMQAMYEAADAAQTKEAQEATEKPKSKKELALELKSEKLQALQAQGLSKVYKQLAKSFHPDLVQDSAQKLEREEFMKRLTSAYDNKDMHTLLMLELEWMSRSEQQSRIQSNEELKIYNSLLKDQVQNLEGELGSLSLHPKYMPIYRYLTDAADPFFMLNTMHRDIVRETKYFKQALSALQSERAQEYILDIIASLP